MELLIRARLDSSGKIESVQSSLQTISGESIDPGNDVTDRYVPYAQKKEVVKRLDNKMDEMSLLIMQMAELTRRNELQEKLIRQYEEKITTLEHQLQRYQNMQGDVTTKSDGTGAQTARKLVRNSQTSIKVSINTTETSVRATVEDKPEVDTSQRCSVQMDQANNNQNGKTCENNLSKEGSTLEKDKNELASSACRPQTLNIDVDLDDTDGTVTSNITHVDLHHDVDEEIPIKNGYSYVKKRVCLIEDQTQSGKFTVQPDVSSGTFFLQPEESSFHVKTQPGALVNSDSIPIYRKPDKVRHTRHENDYLQLEKDCSMPEITDPDNIPSWKELCGTDQEKDVVDPDIHSPTVMKTEQPERKSGQIERSGPVTGRLDQTQPGVGRPEPHVDAGQATAGDGYLPPITACTQRLQRAPRYAEIDDSLVVVEHNVDDRPPLPTPRRQHSISDIETSPLSALVSPEINSTPPTPEHPSACVSQKCSCQSIDRETNGQNNNRDVTLRGVKVRDVKQFERHGSLPVSAAAAKSVTARLEGSQTLPRMTRGRSNSTPQIHKPEDELNVVLKDMRTTMEWNQEKRRLVFESTSCTSQQAESKLSAVVQRLHEAFEKLVSRRQKALDAPIQAVAKKLCDVSHLDLGVSEDFCCKCIGLFQMVHPRVKTP